MTAVAPALGLAEPDARPPFAAPASAAQLLETCAAAAAVGSAIELGVFARVTDECGFKADRRRSLAGAVPLSLITARRR